MSDVTGKWPCVMIDIETLATTDDAVILEVGAVCFDRVGRSHGPEWGMALDHVAQPGRRVCPETLAWWLAPERISRLAELMDGHGTRPLLWHAMQELTGFLGDHLVEGGEVWAKGDFDLRILGQACGAEGLPVPWKYYQARELRTVLKWMGVDGKAGTGSSSHQALADARRQVGLLWDAEEELGERQMQRADWAAGWAEYRQELAETRACLVPAWEMLSDEVKDAWCAGVRAAVEAGVRWRAR